jgi:hypothetical protein
MDTYGRAARLLVRVGLVVALTGCAAQRPQIMHLEQLGSEPEHDEVLVSDKVVDIYPNIHAPHRMISRKNDGCVEDFTCLNGTCTDKEGPIIGCSQVPNGEYRITVTDDPRIAVIRETDTGTVVKYTVINPKNLTNHNFDTLPEAQAYAHRGETTIKVLKVTGAVLIVGAVVAGAAFAGAAAANANRPAPVCTTCQTNPLTGISTCTSR